jgi:hypothetical protein
MRNFFALNSAQLALFFSLGFACGCQNEMAATDQVQPDRVSQSKSVKARGLSISQEVALDRIASEGMHDSTQVSWESDLSNDSNKSQPPNLEEVFNLESTELGKLTGDASETENLLK